MADEEYSLIEALQMLAHERKIDEFYINAWRILWRAAMSASWIWIMMLG